MDVAREPVDADEVDALRAQLAGGVTVAARPAATVLLIADSDDGLAVYVQRRRASLAFAAGMVVYPGGSVEPEDADAIDAAHDLHVRATAAAFGIADDAARALLGAAVRETAEEAGVLFAEGSTPTIGAALADLATGQEQLSAVLRRHGLVPTPQALVAYAHWITPRHLPRRFDTHFLLAALPGGQHPRLVGSESSESGWHVAAQLLAAARAGTVPMWAPTIATLRDLAAFDTADQALASARGAEIAIVEPYVEIDGERMTYVYPHTAPW